MATIRIGAIDYEIQMVDEIPNLDGAFILLGQIRYSDCTILIRKGPKKQRIFETLIHEAIHGWMETTGNRPNDEELVVGALSPIVVRFLKDNWKLLQRMGELK